MNWVVPQPPFSTSSFSSTIPMTHKVMDKVGILTSLSESEPSIKVIPIGWRQESSRIYRIDYSCALLKNVSIDFIETNELSCRFPLYRTKPHHGSRSVNEKLQNALTRGWCR